MYVRRALHKLSTLTAQLSDLVRSHELFMSTERGHLRLYRLMFAIALDKALVFKACHVPIPDALRREITWATKALMDYRQEHPEVVDVPCQQMNLFKEVA